MFEQTESGRVKTPFEPLILAAALALIPVLIVQRDVHSGPWPTVANAANWLIWAVFAAEVAVILTVAPRKLAALRAHWFDVLITVMTVPVYGRLFSAFRLARLARLLRLLRVTAVVGRALQAERRLTSTNAFRFVALATVFLTVVAGAVQATVDRHEFKTFWDGTWWAAVTVTTVGYGDIAPHTVVGRVVAIVVILMGIGFLAVLTATISSHFVKVDQDDDNIAIRQALERIEVDVADLKNRFEAAQNAP